MLSIPLFIGTGELLLLGGVALLLFGGKKLPELMKGLGQGIQSFKQGMSEPLPENKASKKEENEAHIDQQFVKESEDMDGISNKKTNNIEASSNEVNTKA